MLLLKEKCAYPKHIFRRAEVFVARGLHPRNRLEKILKQDLSNIPLGDPGLLASTLIDASGKKYKVGIIPHHIELSFSIWSALQKSIKNSIIIDVSQNPLQILKQISQCEIIVSSALHGLIAADSFGIPNRRIIASNKLIGGDYKFNDYYSAFGIQKHKSIDIRAGISNLIDIDQIKKEYEIDNKIVDSIREKLKMSFPF